VLGEIMRRIGSKALPALLLVLALLLLLQVRQKQSEEKSGGVSSSMTVPDHRSGLNSDLPDTAPGKPGKVNQRPEQPERGKSKGPILSAEPVPGQPGFVYHPVSRQIVDVRGIPAGLMVRQGFGEMFLIPKMGYVITSEAYRKAVWGNFGTAASEVTLSSEGEADVSVWSIGNGNGVSVVSCRPMHWETKWDDGTPFVPDGEIKEEPESFLE
jgi:hypothetical protein